MTGASISRLADASRTNLGRVEPLGALGLDSASFELSGASVFKTRDFWCVDFLSSRRYATSIFDFMTAWYTDFLSSTLCSTSAFNFVAQICSPLPVVATVGQDPTVKI